MLELGVCGKGRKIIINLIMQVPLIAINIPWNRVEVEEWPLNDGGLGQIQRRGFSRALMGVAIVAPETWSCRTLLGPRSGPS